MRGYAEGGYVGGAGKPAQQGGGQPVGKFEQNNHVVIQNDATNGSIGPQALAVVYDVARRAAMDVLAGQQRDGGMLSGGRG